MDIKEKKLGVWAMLAKATGYSKVYCRKVVTGNRSQESKGGIIIMSKYQSLIDTLDHYYTNEVCVAESEEEMNLLLAKKV